MSWQEKADAFLDEYLFDVAAPSDDRPYFSHFFRWRSLPVLRRQLQGRSRAFLEVGYLLLVAALVQTALLAVGLIVLPLAPGIRSLRTVKGRLVTLSYFLMLGAGFMLLEMGFLQKLSLRGR